jgi:hypothetical protein
MQRSQSPPDTKKCDDADTTLSVASGSAAGEAGLLLVNRNRTTSGGKFADFEMKKRPPTEAAFISLIEQN